MTGFRRKPSDSAFARRGYSHFMPPPELDPYRLQHLAEGRLPDQPHEDTGNYGRGGYYGTTHNHELYDNRDSSSRQDHNGRPDHYRQLGDRRWADEQVPWEKERFSRTGYRVLKDRLETTNHQGKGPRSWRRSDQRLLEEINDRLYDDPFLNATDVAVEVRDGEVFLTGTVDTRQSKRRAEDIAESVSGVRHMENRLRVK